MENPSYIYENEPLLVSSWQDQDGEVEISKSAFVELVQTLLSDKYEKDKFVKVSSVSTVTCVIFQSVSELIIHPLHVCIYAFSLIYLCYFFLVQGGVPSTLWTLF